MQFGRPVSRNLSAGPFGFAQILSRITGGGQTTGSLGNQSNPETPGVTQAVISGNASEPTPLNQAAHVAGAGRVQCVVSVES